MTTLGETLLVCAFFSQGLFRKLDKPVVTPHYFNLLSRRIQLYGFLPVNNELQKNYTIEGVKGSVRSTQNIDY